MAVYLSHIHSYMEYSKDGVRYLISGGAGAELLTENSYSHYLIQSIGEPSTTVMVELPSPANQYLTRYAATVQLFATSMYEEHPLSVTLILTALSLLLILLILKFYLSKKDHLHTGVAWLRDVWNYSVSHYKELFRTRHL